MILFFLGLTKVDQKGFSNIIVNELVVIFDVLLYPVWFVIQRAGTAPFLGEMIEFFVDLLQKQQTYHFAQQPGILFRARELYRFRGEEITFLCKQATHFNIWSHHLFHLVGWGCTDAETAAVNQRAAIAAAELCGQSLQETLA